MALPMIESCPQPTSGAVLGALVKPLVPTGKRHWIFFADSQIYQVDRTFGNLAIKHHQTLGRLDSFLLTMVHYRFL